MTTELNNLIEEYRKKWDIKGVNIWWEEPFKKCFELGQLDKEKDVLKIIDDEIKHCKMAIIGGNNILHKNIGVNARTRHRKTIRKIELKLEILEELKNRIKSK